MTGWSTCPTVENVPGRMSSTTALFGLPMNEAALIRHCTLSDVDLEQI